MIEFAAWPKTPRLFRDMVITEKIDGTNAAVHVERYEHGQDLPGGAAVVRGPEWDYLVAAQSRKRLIDRTDDNFGFAAWVWENAGGLVGALGEGVHYGEWWGSGIQRGYGLEKGHRRFSLFNVNRYVEAVSAHDAPSGLGLVPTLYEGPFDTNRVDETIIGLRTYGSVAAPGFDWPEGVIVFHSAANSVFKVTLENDEKPKG